ncbi:TPA: hypothetical protein ACUIB6_002629 [Staphylococcus aureus]|nr:hypothetical protein [Staphylococcus aureus]HDE9964381.1 hypothetical protein [Staphylococcus aureus]HDG8341314.1 hypothetical protein [Staphylococcus aureus]HDG8822011.1 hypothetical protein [Staphylococcus aureus]
MRKYILLFASLVLVVALASCSNNSNPKQKKTTKDDEMKVGEMMQEDKEHVWFVTRDDEELTKDSQVDRYIVTKNGKMKVYVAERVPAQTLGDLLNKDEKSLIKDIKKQDEWFFKFDKSEIVAKTNADIKNAKDLQKKGYDEYSPSKESHGGTDYAVIKKERENQSPEESLKELEKYKQDIENLSYKEPKSKKVDLKSIGSGELELSIARNYGYPKIIGTGSDVDNIKKLTFTNTLSPKSINNKNIAGLNNYDESQESEEGTSPYLVTIVDNKIKKVLIDKPTDPAIKDNQEYKHKKSS